MSSIIKRTVASKLKSIVMYFAALALVLGGVSYAAPKFFGQTAHAAGPWSVNSSLQNDSLCVSLTLQCKTIQAAVNAAGSGDTINVGAGTYNESPNITKSVILQSTEGINNTTVRSLTIATSNVTVSGFTIEGINASGAASANVFLKSGVSNVTVSNNKIINVGSGDDNVNGDSGVGLLTTSDLVNIGDNLNVTGNIFQALDTGSNRAFYINPGINNFNFSGNTITGNFAYTATTQAKNGLVENNKVTGAGAVGSRSAGFRALGEPNPTVWGHTTFSGNIVSGVARGITVDEANNVTITGNTLSGNGIGVRVVAYSSLPFDITTISIHNNNLSGEDTYGVTNNEIAIATSLDATNNWWGSASGPGAVGHGTGDKVSTNVNYKPWCTDLGCTTFSSDNPTTTVATVETSTTATLNGIVGTSNADNTSFWWGTTSAAGPFTPGTDPGNSSEFPAGWIHDNGLGAKSAGGSFSEPLTGLTPGTTYHFVAWSLVGGTWYPGEISSFTTAHKYTQADFTAFNGVNIGTNSYTVSTGITATYDNGTGTESNPVLLKLTGYAPIVTPWFGKDWTTYNYVTVGIQLPAGFTGAYVYQTGIMRYDENQAGAYKMSSVGNGSTPLATAGAAVGYLDYSFAANSDNTKKDGLVKLKVIWTEGATPEYFTIDINNLSLTDTTAPTIPVLTSPINGVFIKNNAPLMQWNDSTDTGGSGIAGYEYQVYYNCTNPDNIPSSCSSVTNVNSLSSSEYQAGSTGDGVYYWQVRAKDNAGNFSNWSELEKVTIDTTSPNFTITRPTAAQVINNRIITINGTATDTNFNYYYCYVSNVNGHEYGVRDASCTTTWHAVTPAGLLGSVTLPNDLPDGNYVVHLIGYDKAMNSAETTQSFVLDNTAPNANITSPLVGGYVRGTIDITGAFSDNNHEFNSIYMGFTGNDKNGNQLSWCHSEAPGFGITDGTRTCSFDTTKLSDGSHKIEIWAMDKAGNWGTGSNRSINVMVDNTMPTGGSLTMQTKLFPAGLTITSPTDGVYTLQDLSMDGADQFQSLSVVVIDSNLKTDNVPVYVNGLENGYMTYAAGVWNYEGQTSKPDFSTGTQNLIATFSDLAGNNTMLTVRFTTDNTAPTIDLNGSALIDVVYGSGSYVELDATATESAAVIVGGDTITPTSPVGIYHVTYDAVDAAGNHAVQVVRTVNVTKANQTALTVVSPLSTVIYGSISELSITGGNGTGTVTYSAGASTGCSISGSTLSVTNASVICVVTATKAADVNYNLATSGVLTIVLQKADSTITVTCSGDQVYTGSAITPCTANVTGTGSLNQSVTVDYADNTNVGTATATATFVGDVNHNGSSNSKIFGITKAHLTVTADAKSKVYGKANPSLTATISGFVNGEVLGTSGVTGSAAVSTEAAALTGVSNPAITVAAGSLAAANYDFTVFTPGVLTITQAPLTITAEAKTKVAGTADPVLTYTITSGSLVGTDTFTGALARPSGEAAGSYLINKGSLALNSNYNIKYIGAILTITTAPVATSSTTTIPAVVATDTTSTTAPSDTAVLGSQTTSDSTSAVKGSTDTKNTNSAPSVGFFASASFGIYNWILVIIGALALAGAGWWAFAIRRRG